MIPVENIPSDVPTPTVERRKEQNGYYTSADYHALYSAGDLTPTAVVETLLPMIRRDAKPPGKHSTAFLESQAEIIREAAAASTERYKKGQPLGPLDGVPVAIKDEVHITGYKRTLGTKLDFKAGSDATSWCVKQWQDAGAIVIGKTTMHELGLGELPVCIRIEIVWLITQLLFQIQTTTTPITGPPEILTTRTTTAAVLPEALATPLAQDLCPLHSAQTAEARSASPRLSAVSGD